MNKDNLISEIVEEFNDLVRKTISLIDENSSSNLVWQSFLDKTLAEENINTFLRQALDKAYEAGFNKGINEMYTNLTNKDEN